MIRAFPIIAALIFVAGCSTGSLKRVDGDTVERLGIGLVMDSGSTQVDSDESLGERVALGTVSAGIIGGVATAITEPGFTKQTLQRYVIRMNDGTYKTQLTRSIVDIGSCVELTLREGHVYPIARKITPDRCVKRREQ